MEGVHFKLMANIDLTEFLEDENPTHGWQPVGNSSNAAFKGILDGNGKTVSGLWIKRSGTDYVGLFGYTNGATIKNLTIADNTIVGNNKTGGISGYSVSTTISGCSYSGTITGGECVGGLIGDTGDNMVLSNNTVSVTLTATGDNAGGFIGKNDAYNNLNISDCRLSQSCVQGVNHVGGACGSIINFHGTTNSLTNCYINSEVLGSAYVGGICGYSKSDNHTVNLTSCGFIGNVYATSYAGGLVGYVEKQWDYNNDYMKKCFVVGNVIATDNYVGGLVGYDKGYRYGSYDNRIKSNNISDSYYSGSISGQYNVGGLVGYKMYGEISKCYAIGNVVGASNVGGLVGYNASRSTVKTSVAILSRITASEEIVNRIVGKNEGTIAAVGSTEENKSYNRTVIILKGAAQDIEDNQLNGTGVSTNTLKLKASYVAMGWDFTDTWAIQETECYPYMRVQTAPPVITSNLVSNATTISGKCIDGGVVTLEIDGEKKSMTSVNHKFSFTVKPLKSGHTVRISAKANDKEQSYYTEQMVSYPGSGTEADPYLVYTADDLTGVYRKGYYKLMNDIDLTEWINVNSPTEGWTGIGREGSDMSQFDGNGFTISGLWSNTTRDYTGLFSMFSNGTIKNLKVVTASGKKVKGGNNTGILIGYLTNGKILDCTVDGDVEGITNVGGVVGAAGNDELTNLIFNGTVTSATDNANVGGIAGTASSSISKCISKGSLTATGEMAQVGGIVGTNQINGIVSDCCSSATLNSPYAVGGIVSYNYGTVTRSLASGNLYTNNYAAGIIGYNDGANATVSKCVAVNNKIDVTYESQQVQQGGGYGQRIIGGIKNDAPAPEMDNYALKTMQVSVNDVAQKVYDDIMNGTAKTLEQLNTQSTYTELGWDFTSTWYMNASTGLPDLKTNMEKTSQTLDLTEIPTMTYGHGTYQLPAQTNEGLALTWTIGNSNVASISGNVLTIKKAGTTSVSAIQEGNSDYKPFNKSYTLTITKAPLTITAQNCSKNVGEENPAFTVKYEGFVLNEDETVLTSQPTIQTEATADSPVGTYSIKVSGAEADNYDITFVSGTLTVVDEIAMKNVLAIEDISGRSGVQFILPVELRNEDNITALQFDLTLPAGVTIAKNSKGKYIVEKTSRCADHTLSASKPGDANTYKVLLYSNDVDVITGNSGAVVNVKLEVSDEMEAGDYDVTISNINLTRADEVKITPASVTCTLTISNSIPGDANGDGDIDVTDIVTIANYILGRTSDTMDLAGADANGDGEIDVTDIVTVANIILHGGNNQNNAKMRADEGMLDPQ